MDDLGYIQAIAGSRESVHGTGLSTRLPKGLVQEKFILQAVPEQIAKGFWCKNLARKRCSSQYGGAASSMDWCKLCCSLLQTKLLSF